MSVLFVALPVAILLGAVAVVAFVVSARSGQFDDLETPRWRMLMDEERRTDHAAQAGGDSPNGSVGAPS